VPAPPILPHGTIAATALSDAREKVGPEAQHIPHPLGGSDHLHLVLPHDTPVDAGLVAVVPLGLEGFDRVKAIVRLLASLHHRPVPPDTRLTPQQRARARRMLQAFDGRQTGATHKEIAEVLFRTGKLTRDEWQAASERHAVMSLLEGAEAMIAGGYRSLLRHRRRS